MYMEKAETIEGFKLSPQQRHAWMHRASLGDAAAVCLVAVQGALDPEALREALRRIVSRHEILRTRFFAAPGRPPVQVIEEDGEPELRVLDLPGTEPGRRDAELRSACSESGRPFALDGGALLRAVLLRWGAGEQALVLAVPALCADTWTMHNLVAEIAVFCGGDAAGLDEEPMQYADFAEWQNDLAADGEEGAAYWRSVDLSPFAGLAELSPGSGGALPPGSVVWRISGERRHALDEWAAACGVPLPAALLTVWQLALQELSGDPDLLIGDVSHGRKFPPLHSACGLFSKVLPVRCRREESLLLDEALRRTAGALAENDAHQEYFSWELLAGAAGDGGARSFPCTFELDDLPADYPSDGAVLSIRRIWHWSEPFAMRLRVSREGSGLLAELSFDLRRFQPEAVRHLAGRVDALLARAAESPSSTVRSLTSPGPAEAHLLLVELNDRGAHASGSLALHRRFEARASLHPEATAILWEGEELTYRDIDRRANRLAHALGRRGIGPGAVVAVLLERSPELVVSLLAVWKAGAAFVALVPDQAPDRLAYMLDDAAARLVLTAERFLPVLPEGAPEAVCLDRCDLASEPGEAPEIAADPARLAYVVYTSGSTGRPKGVLALHRGVSNYLGYLESAYALGGGDVVLQIASPDFDASVRDLLGPLAFGARLVLLRNEEARDPAALLAGIERHGVSAILSLVPTLLRALLAAASAAGADFRSVRLVLLSGEVLHAGDCIRLRELIRQDAVVVNQYGPTECTMTSTFHRVVSGSAATEAVPVGRPIPNARLYLLAEDLVPVSLGAAGEVYIGGPGLARGYLSLPDLTARCFVPDPFGGEPGARLYRTGDLARIDPGGCLQFLGRRDAQVKIRGIRVELEEIETLLRRHPDLREVAVQVWTPAPEDQRLVAYAAARKGAEPRLTEIRQFLKPQLPEAMLPVDLVLLGSLPLTRTGKVDRGALPAPEERAREHVAMAPRTATEELLADIWCGLLGLGRVEPESDFFDLGGHSLLATQLMARVRRVFEVELPLQSLFERPKLGSFAQAIDEALLGGARSQMPPILPVPREDKLLLSFAQQRHLFLHQLQPESPLLNITAAVRLEGGLDPRALEHALSTILRRHEVLRTAYPEVGGEPVQRVMAGVELRIPLIDLSALPERHLEDESLALILAEFRRPFDLARPPLLRVTLLRSCRTDHIFLLNMHHIGSDLWSVGVLVGELMALYDEAVAGTPARLPELPIQYCDFAQWQRQWLTGDVLAAQLAYWKQQLADPPPPLDLAAVRLPAEPAAHRSAQRAVTFPEELTSRLKELSRTESATLFMTLLAGFQVLLHCYSGGREDLVVGAPFANRMRPEVEPLIGCFINAVALRVDLRGNPTFRELMGRVRRVVLQASAHQDVPFERVVEELNPDRSAGRLPLFEVVFNFQNAPMPENRVSGLEVSVLDLDTGAEAKYDLTLYLGETAGRLGGAISYDAARLAPSRVAELADDLEHILERAAGDGATRLTDFRGMLAARAERRAAVLSKDLRETRLQRLQQITNRAPRRVAGAEPAVERAGEASIG